MYENRDSLVYDSLQVKQLRNLVSLGESSTLEFKRKVSHPEKVVREMIAFASSGGGYCSSVLRTTADTGTKISGG
jgi:hypothetical protein